MDILAIIIGAVGIACGIMFFIALLEGEFGLSFIALVISALCLLLSYNLFKIDVARDEKKFTTAIVTKTYESTVTEVQGVYKDKVVAGDKQYNIDLKYSETKETTELKPSDPIRITYVSKSYGGNIVIKVEKLIKP
jgi:hypothetical protein